MHVSSEKIGTHHKQPDGRIFAWMALLSSIGYASFLTMLPIILAEKLHNDTHIGYYYSGIAIISLIVSLSSSVLLKRFSKVTLTKIILSTLSVAFIGLSFASSIYRFASIDIARVVCITLFFIILAIFVHDYAEEKEMALAEGRFYLFTNIGWVIGPVAGGLLARFYGNEAALIFAAICYLILVALFFQQNLVAKNPHLHHRKEEIIPTSGLAFWKNVSDYVKIKELRQAFLVSFGLYFWWSISSIYIPLALSNLGYSQAVIGLVISLSVIPLVLLEFHATDGAKKFGIRKYIVLGYALLSTLLLLFTISAPDMLIKLMILINIGAAFIEPNKEIFFFKTVKPQDEERLYGIYNASYPIAYIIAPTFGAILLSSFGISGVWIGTAFVFILVALSSLSISKKY